MSASSRRSSTSSSGTRPLLPPGHPGLTILALVLSGYLINVYTKPVKRIIAASTEMAVGFYHRIEVDPHDDDDARNLGQAFNGMVDAIEERDRQLKELAERTILKSEKLASIGRLASGIAHEINNPLTGVLTYSSLLLEDMKGTTYEEDLKVIRDETLRCRSIVRGILDFARENKPEKALADINAVIDDSLRILEKHVNFQNIEIVKALDPNLPRSAWTPARSGRSSTTWPSTPPTPCRTAGRLTITTRSNRRPAWSSSASPTRASASARRTWPRSSSRSSRPRTGARAPGWGWP